MSGAGAPASAPAPVPLEQEPPLPAASIYPPLAMATLCVGGGLIGLVQRGSARSLVAGTLLGGAFAWSSHCLATEQQLRGYRFATATSLLLTAAMGARLYRTGAIVPSGVLTRAGAASTAYMGRKWQEWA